MAVPQFLLSFRQRPEDLLTDDLFNSHQLGLLVIAVVYRALREILAQPGTLVVRLHLTIHPAVVKMKAVQVHIQSADFLSLQEGGSCLQRPGLRCFFVVRRCQCGWTVAVAAGGHGRRQDQRAAYFQKGVFIVSLLVQTCPDGPCLMQQVQTTYQSD
jgi:hypothetical protein